MSMNTCTLLRAGHRKTVGLCHSIQGCPVWHFTKWLGIPAEEIDYTAGGINHVDFYLTLTHKGRDIYPLLLANEDKIVKEYPGEKIRFELLRRLGYFPAEGPMHQAEYCPWFMKNENTGKEFGAEFGFGYRVDSANAKQKTIESHDIISGKKDLNIKKSGEYAADIIYSLETGKTLEIYGNVKNTGLIENLPPDCIVEVPCLVGKDAIKPCYVGKLPPHLAAVMTPHIYLYEMAVNAVFSRDRRSLLQALQIDPLTGAILTLSQIETMFNELCEANQEYMKDWKK